MLFNVSYLEWIGYLGSVLVAISLTMSSILKLRWLNLVGATVFSFYGFAIGALPVGLLNLFIVLANIFYLIKIYSRKESFKTVVVNPQDAYVNYFLDCYKPEIDLFFPKFEKVSQTFPDEKTPVSFLLLRNAVVAGIFYGTQENDVLNVHLDFVIAEYRDFKPGDFIYKKNTQFFKDNGVRLIVCNTQNAVHQKYLQKMGFSRIIEGLSTDRFEKKI